jgi:hypothetical protein
VKEVIFTLSEKSGFINFRTNFQKYFSTYFGTVFVCKEVNPSIHTCDVHEGKEVPVAASSFLE